MQKLTFKEWLLAETGTSTADVALYPRPLFANVKVKKEKKIELPKIVKS